MTGQWLFWTLVCLTQNICQNIFEKQLAMKLEIRIMANYQIGIPFIIIANLCNDNLGGRRNTYGGVVRTPMGTVVRTPTRTVVRTSTANYV
jgi:hypothetical protein